VTGGCGKQLNLGDTRLCGTDRGETDYSCSMKALKQVGGRAEKRKNVLKGRGLMLIKPEGGRGQVIWREEEDRIKKEWTMGSYL